MNIKENTEKEISYLRVIMLSALVGGICGLVGNIFVQSIAFVTQLREKYSWILYLLVIFGVVIVGVYKLLKVENIGTNNVLNSVRSDKKVSPILAIAIFIGTVLSHFGGASVGREGAALQLGGSIGEGTSRIYKLDDDNRKILVMSGMAGCFSALFGTPFAAFLFVLEVARIGKKCVKSILPVIASSVIAFFIANSLGVEPERFALRSIPQLTLNLSWKFVLITVAGAVVSMIFVHSLHFSEKLFKKIIPNDFLRITVGGVLVIALTKILGTTDYNGGGINIVHHIFTNGDVNYEAFLLKIVFTAISVGCGYKGGEIVPTIFIGGTLGGAMGSLLGIDPAFAASIGIVALFSGATKSPFATVVLACEMFGIYGVGYFAVASAISYFLSFKGCLYKGGTLPFIENK